MWAHNFTKGAPANSGVLVPLSEGDLRHRAPSVFADRPAPGLSSRYQFVQTAAILGTLRDAGFEVVKASQSVARTPEGTEYAKHMLRLAPRDYLTGRVLVGDVIPEVVLTNSHNRTSAFVLDLGFYRLLCSNGLMVCTQAFAGVRVMHSDRNIHQHIIDGTDLIREVAEQTAVPQIERMQHAALPMDVQKEFALAATLLKWDQERPEHVDNLLEPRRKDDEGDSVWHVMNRIQENAVRGGYKAHDRAGRNVTTNGIKAVDRDREFNQNLWSLGVQLTEMVI